MRAVNTGLDPGVGHAHHSLVSEDWLTSLMSKRMEDLCRCSSAASDEQNSAASYEEGLRGGHGSRSCSLRKISALIS